MLLLRPLDAKTPAHPAAKLVLKLLAPRCTRTPAVLASPPPVGLWETLLRHRPLPPVPRPLLPLTRMLECGPRSWRTKVQTDLRTEDVTK